jgi:dTMP kinase
MKNLPRLIVVEGCHGSGKTTLAKALVRTLNKGGLRTRYTKEPYSPILSKAIDELASKQGRNPLALAYLIAVDRQLHLRDIRRWLRIRETVVSDRYMDSSLVYQRIDGLSKNMINRLNFFAPRPGVTIYLNTPYEVRVSRLRKKGRFRSGHVFLSPLALKKEQRLYREIQSHNRGRHNTLELDGTGSIRENAATASEFVMRHI